MLNIVKEKLDLSSNLKKKINWAKKYTSTPIKLEKGYLIRLEPSNLAYVDPHKVIINGSIRKIDKTNLTYIEPHRIIINNTTFLAFNYSNEIFIENLSNKIKLSELENYLKSI